MVAEAAALIVAIFALGAELLHARRVRRLAQLSFGPGERPRAWARFAPLARVLSLSALAWGLSTLYLLQPKVHAAEKIADNEKRHLMLVLDVSPSMRLQDAGPTHKQSRTQRAADLIESLFQRSISGQFLISVVAVYNGAKPVVVDTSDMAVVENILRDLPMHYAFEVGQTRIFDGLEEAAKIARPWQPKSTTLVLLSDGDTVPATGMPALPVSVSHVLVVGVGDPLVGTFIDGHQSRQDTSTLRQVAARLGGVYHNGNEQHIATDTLRTMTQNVDASRFEQLTRREYALLACAIGALVYALLPVLLQAWGTTWKPGVPCGTDVTRVAPIDTARRQQQEFASSPSGALS
ncbi:MAG: VWA domain-containing protein [Pirellulales bacterium]|nr:VWA domain-containing protein [Pirellulales bacterium]